MKVFYNLLSLPPPKKSIHCQLFVLFSFVFCVFIKYIWRSFLNMVNISVNKNNLVLFSRSVMSNSLWPNGLQHARLREGPSPTLRVCSNSCLSSPWCHPTISSSVISFSLCPQSFPASGSFQSQFFASGGQITGASASVLPMNIQDWFLLELTG